MAIPGPSTPQPSLSWRQVQSHLRNVVLSQPLRDADSLLDVLLPTLHILDLGPSPLALPAHTAQRHTAQRVFGRLIHGRPLEEDAPLGGGEEGDDEEAWLRAFRSQAWLGDIQRSLLVGSIAESWDHEMNEREPEMWEALRRAWFVPRADAQESVAAAGSVPSSGKMIIMEASEEQDAAQQAKRLQSAAAMTLSGLQALSSALSTLAAGTTPSTSRRPQPNPLLSSTLQVTHWYGATPGLLNLLLEGTRMQGNAAKRSLVWGEVVKILASLQDRVANAAAGDGNVDVDGFAKAWGKSLLRQLVEKLFAAEGDKADLPLLAELFTKLIRTSPQLLTAASSATDDDGHVSFWPALLRQLITLSAAAGLQLPPQVQKRWHSFLTHLDSRDRQNVDLSLAHFLHRQFLQIEVVDAAKETGRPAAVGKGFLSGETAQRVELGARLLGMLWGSTTAAGASTNPKEDGQGSSDEDDDDDDEEDHFTHLLTQIILPSQRSSSALLWSPGMARAFVCYIAGASSSKAQSTTERLQAVLARAIEQWGNADRVRRTTTQEEHYFVALILGVLAELSNNSAEREAQPGLTASRSGTFIQGVGAHLEHPDPEVRRMGMLLAEVVSEVAHREQQEKDGKPPLSFGSSMWDGIGEGREEARVLRAAWHGWGMMREGGKKGLEGATGEEVLRMLGLEEPPEVPIAQESTVAVRNAPRPAPRTRQLPQRMPARRDGQLRDTAPQSKAGVRSLIVELDDEDEGAAAGSSSRLDQDNGHPNKPRLVASIESDNDDSSSESGSSSDDDREEPSLPTADDADITSALPNLPRAQAAAKKAATSNDEPDELLGLGIDKKKRRPPPVYISDLTSMLRDHKERDSIRLALKHGEELLRRKGQLAASAPAASSTTLASFSSLSLGAGTSRGPRGEIDEHSIDLLLLLCALQNNYRIHSFEPRRRAMLRCLVIWAPRIAVPALVEQIFAPNYSITQRLGMLGALGLGARELCGLEGGEGKGEEMGMRGWTDEAIGRARKEGEERVPEIKRERDLQRLTDVGAAAGRTRMLRRPQQEGGRAGIQEIGTSTTGQSTVQRLPSRYSTQHPATASASASATPPLSSSLFIFPLLTRLRSHLSDASSRLSRARQITNFTHNSTNPSSLGLATPDLFTASPPLLLPAILDTLAMLTATYVQEQRPTPLDAHGVVLPEMLEVATHVIREGLPLLAFAAKNDDGKQRGSKGEAEGGESGNVVAAISSLILVTLDLALESPSAEASRLLVATERGAAALDDALKFASGVFESEDAKSGAGSGRKGVGMGISRTGRICAAIVVRIEELRQRERERWLGGLGSR